MTARRWEIDAEECVSAAHAACIYCVDHFEPHRGSLPYFVGLRVRHELNRIRHQTIVEERRRVASLSAGGDANDSPFDPPGRPEDDDRSFVQLEVRAAVARLPPKLRQVTKLTWFDETEGVEVARRMGVSKQYVHQLREKAAAKLRERLSESLADAG